MEIKTIVTILFLSMLGLSLGANASTISSDEPWVDATEGITGGSTAITWFPANQNSSSSSTLDHAQTIIEVYTATWCETCIPAEEALNASITDHAVKVVKYHRHCLKQRTRLETITPKGVGLAGTALPRSRLISMPGLHQR